MLKPIFWRGVRHASVLPFFIVLLLISSCSDDVGLAPEPAPDPQGPLPENRCGANVTEGYTDKVSYSPTEQVTAYLRSTSVIAACKLTIFHVNGGEAFSLAT